MTAFLQHISRHLLTFFFFISLQEEVTHTQSRREVCLWENVVSEQNHNRNSKCVTFRHVPETPLIPEWKIHLSSKGFLLRKKLVYVPLFCYHGHLNKDSILLLEPSPTAVGKKMSPSALKYVPLHVVIHATKAMIIWIEYIWSKHLRKFLPPYKYFNNGRQICLRYIHTGIRFKKSFYDVFWCIHRFFFFFF